MLDYTKQRLKAAWEYGIQQGKSTEWIIQYMQDVTGVDFDCVMKYLYDNRDKEKE